jgi:uncharacterized repeat protein (TIGR03803 family)
MSSAYRQYLGYLIAYVLPNTRCCRSAARSLCLKAFLALGALWLAIGITPMALQAQTYTDLHDFDCTVEGCQPDYPEVLAQGRDGNLYGTTNVGGTLNMGTVFKMTPSGTITTLYNFSGADGQNPEGGLVLGTDGNFYGATTIGGANNDGTVFKITPAGVLTTLHSFTASDSNPKGGVVQGKNGSLYGTTCSQFGPWTGFSITSAGKFKHLTNSIPPCSFSGLILGSDGNFYGASQVGGNTYQGTVFRMSPSGAVKILYSFDYTHGAYLYSPVVQGNDGFLYGTTSGGGSAGEGVVFKLSTSGKLTLLHEFDSRSGNDGNVPFAGLVAASDGKFYGAAEGPNFGLYPNGDLFSISSGGSYSPLYAFDSTHGALPVATPMQHTNGLIYGVTERGGGPQGGVLYNLDNGLPRFVNVMTRWGSGGQTVEILGNGLTGTTSVKFGSGSASFIVVSDTYMTASVPDDGTAGFVTVTTPSDTLISSRTFDVVPVISSIAPTSGPVGTQVTITGSGFIGASQVKFGGVKGTYTVNSGTTITATVPAGAKTGKVSVKTAGGNASSKATFTVTP